MTEPVSPAPSSDVLTLCLRLCLEPANSHSPETQDVLDRYRPAWEAAAGGLPFDEALALLPPSEKLAIPDYAAGRREERDKDWVLAIGHALGLNSGYQIPIIPEVEPFKTLFAAMRREWLEEAAMICDVLYDDRAADNYNLPRQAWGDALDIAAGRIRALASAPKAAPQAPCDPVPEYARPEKSDSTNSAHDGAGLAKGVQIAQPAAAAPAPSAEGTPRTDAVAAQLDIRMQLDQETTFSVAKGLLAFSRTLERENARLREEREAVWEVGNKVSSCLFATEADADKFMGKFSASTGFVKHKRTIAHAMIAAASDGGKNG